MSISDKLLTIAENEQRVYDAGYEKGKQEGGDTETAYSQGFDAGKQAEYDALWDSIQDYGNRKRYPFAFSSDMWTPETFKPKYPIQPTMANNMFGYWGSDTTRNYRFDFRGLPLDFSKAEILYNCFTGNYLIQAVGEINTTSAGTLSGFFNEAISLETVEKLVLKSDGSQQYFTNTFNNCRNLKNITIEGVIGDAISFGNSLLLTHDSLISIINHLKDFSGTTTTMTCTLGATNLAKLTDAEKAIATEKGWSLA